MFHVKQKWWKKNFPGNNQISKQIIYIQKNKISPNKNINIKKNRMFHVKQKWWKKYFPGNNLNK